MNARLAAVLSPAALLLALLPGRALAQTCPNCTNNAECAVITSNPQAKCVVWFTPQTACSPARQVSCCPDPPLCTVDGQGVPSCVGEGTCAAADNDGGVLVGDGAVGPPSDGGPDFDGGASDVGPFDGPRLEAGVRPDVRTSTRAPGLGGGSGAQRPRDSCSCSTAAEAGAFTSSACVAAFLLALLERRRRGARPSRRRSSANRT